MTTTVRCLASRVRRVTSVRIWWKAPARLWARGSPNSQARQWYISMTDPVDRGT